jgi:hypothetical protein
MWPGAATDGSDPRTNITQIKMGRIENVQVESGRLLQNVSLLEDPNFPTLWN